ncbi:putative ATP-binding cassette transporter [Sporobacter termitidis DSM 10068]|uniref:Putative ATP-binding cassette transporter n=1 Tax=Sporobacter termitidis DSM 10068 TaxID=1123282 RepID=A0A1M5TCT0_9FIRM|nr:ABC transporter ATP-binding protein/permease [Sporobacter termitidis]SHH48529.1 putative ATP-binding cassette transporter [Sporobacter termitidis DSM 10068]
MRNLIKTVKQIGRLSAPYWIRSEDRAKAWLLILADVALMVLVVMANVRYNKWFLDWTNAFMLSNYALWKQQLVLFLAIAAALTLSAGLKAYIEGWLTVSWRNWMTSRYLDDWMNNHNHYRLQITGNSTDNPDQRIQEDINLFITNFITYTLQLIQQIIMFAIFLMILWDLSSAIPLFLGGTDWSFPGYFIVIALVWAFLTTFIVHKVGRRLVKLNYNQQRYEADFRFSLVRVRENSEQISLLRGEDVEHESLMVRLGDVIANTFRVVSRMMKTLLWNTGLSMLNGLVISVLLGPSYFAGSIPGGYGAIMQISQAFQTVLTAFTFFQTSYVGLATWKAVINRLSDFLDSSRHSEEILANSEINITKHALDEIRVDRLDANLPTGQLQISAKDMVIKHGEKVLVKGKTGAGKTTLFRVIADIWPFGQGSLRMPEDKKIMVLPQQPYLPIGRLVDAICYPEPAEKYSRPAIEQALRDVDLEKFVPRLDEVAHWNHLLSGGEQQRVAVARALLYNPDYLFFDEATASMDEPSEEVLYTMLLDRMKDATIVSIGHRSSLQKFHDRTIVAEQQPGGTYRFVEEQAALKY